MKKIAMSIKTQLILILISISTLIVIAVSYFNFISNVDKEKNSFIQNSLIQANLIADFSISPLVFFDSDGANENLSKLRSDDSILRVIIYDENKNIFAQYNPKNLEAPKYSEVIDEIILLNNGFLSYENLVIKLPLAHQDEKYGMIYIEKSTKIISSMIKKVFYDITLFTIILLVVIYFISVFLSNYLLQPILSIAKKAQMIATTRDYSTRVNYESNNEIGVLYESFNYLLKDTQDLTNLLEEKVNQRTKELEKSLEDLKKTQQQLIESEKMSALGNLVSGIAHEINTPLGNAITTSSIIERESAQLLMEYEKGILKRSVMENKLNTLNASSKLLNKSLTYSSNLVKSFKQISVDQVTNDVRKFEIGQYINDIFLTNHNKLKQIPVEVIIHKDEDILIKTSPGVISQIFNNLIQNSILHGFGESKDNSIISITLKKDEEFLYIKYHDNGVGVDSSIINKIYEPFVTTKRNAGGTGLGLNIVYNLICQKLKGTIKLNKEEKIGTTFEIKIPLIYSIEGKQ